MRLQLTQQMVARGKGEASTSNGVAIMAYCRVLNGMREHISRHQILN